MILYMCLLDNASYHRYVFWYNVIQFIASANTILRYLHVHTVCATLICPDFNMYLSIIYSYCEMDFDSIIPSTASYTKSFYIIYSWLHSIVFITLWLFEFTVSLDGWWKHFCFPVNKFWVKDQLKSRNKEQHSDWHKTINL